MGVDEKRASSVLNAGPQTRETGIPPDLLHGEELYNIRKQEEMNAVININKYTEENQLSSQAKSLNLRASNTSNLCVLLQHSAEFLSPLNMI